MRHNSLLWPAILVLIANDVDISMIRDNHAAVYRTLPRCFKHPEHSSNAFQLMLDNCCLPEFCSELPLWALGGHAAEGLGLSSLC